MRAPIRNGLWSDPNTWGLIANTPTHHASTVLTLSATPRATAPFTAPNTTSQIYGVYIVLPTPGTATVTVALREGSTTVATASRSFTQGTATIGGSPYYFEFATPYTYTTTAANTYSYQITATGITNAPTVAADSGGTNAMYYSVDDRTGVPSNEYVLLGAKTVTMDGTRSCGFAGADTTTIGNTLFRYVGLGLQVADGGVLEFDTAASTQLTVTGHVIVSGTGIFRVGTVATKYPSALTGKLIIDQNGGTGNYGYYTMPTASWIWQGREIANRQNTFVSGAGTTASPLVLSLSTSAYSANDQLVFAGSLYNETETRYIRTINGDGSVTLSTTPGGAEAGLTYTHVAGQAVANVEYNLTITTGNSSYSLYGYNTPGTDNLVDVDNVRVEYSGVAGVASKQGIFPSNNGGAGLTSTYGSWDNIGFYIPRYCGLVLQNSQTTQTFSNIIIYGSTNVSGPTSGGGVTLLANTSNKTINDVLVIGYGIPGYFSSSAVNCTVNRLNLWNCNTGNSALIGAMYIAGSTNITFNDISIQGSRLNGICLNGSTKLTFNSVECGNLATNTTDIACISGGTNLECHFETPTFGSATIVSNYTGQGTGSKITMQSVNGTTTDYRTYEDTGTTRSTGAGLADTNVSTAGSLAWRIAPENNVIGMVKDIQVLARVGQYFEASGRIQKNAAFGSSTCTVSLIVDNVTIASTTMPNDTNWNVFTLGGTYSGTTNKYGILRITATTATASAYIYLDDLFNGTNPITALDVWDKGEPSKIMFPQLGDPASVWAVLISGLTTSGTIGWLLAKALTVARFLSFK